MGIQTIYVTYSRQLSTVYLVRITSARWTKEQIENCLYIPLFNLDDNFEVLLSFITMSADSHLKLHYMTEICRTEESRQCPFSTTSWTLIFEILKFYLVRLNYYNFFSCVMTTKFLCVAPKVKNCKPDCNHSLADESIHQHQVQQSSFTNYIFNKVTCFQV